MKVQVDFSIFLGGDEAMGRVSGEIDFAVEPMIGDSINFMVGLDGQAIPDGHDLGGMLRVVDRVVCPGGGDGSLLVILSDMNIFDRQQVFSIIEYMRKGQGLFVEDLI